MAALSSFFKRKSSIPFTSLAIRRWFSTQPILDSPSFSQRIRDLPKDLPGTNIKKEVSQLIGKTPLVFLNKVTEGCGAYVAVKQEMMQPTASIKDRPALAMITDAEDKQLITPGKTVLIEPTSGNMGISMAFMAAMKGYKMVLTMPSYTSLERRVTMRAFGADLILTDPTKGWEEQLKRLMSFWNPPQMLSCFNNFQILPIPRAVFVPNVLNFPVLVVYLVPDFVYPVPDFAKHGPEIWEDTRGQVDIFIMGIGSGGTVSGVGRYLKSQNPNVKIYGLEPTESNVLNGVQNKRNKERRLNMSGVGRVVRFQLFPSFPMSSALPNGTLVETYVVMIISHYGVNPVLLKAHLWLELQSLMLSIGTGPHHITGNGVGFKPDILDMDVMEEVLMLQQSFPISLDRVSSFTIQVSSEDAVNMARQLALKEGLMVGISSGANTVAALRLARRPENKGKLIVTIHPSFGERYLSSVLFQELRKEAETCNLFLLIDASIYPPTYCLWSIITSDFAT
ncbi:L-3-cyanoalanine synthase 1, mitochondrial [Vitis vinifera]|uniref:L-3-cyanoalanine synthase 1, mitochondrial n=1 Tax=Vitis vinifera TaxID=29760 RepID=A0A438JMC0_VITVI|nr:L-3-cyanoalanine synthase 1, mitochondrial [Vitis vinifera]